ncbi:MAG: hypothetical protein WCC08_23130, partial [Terrimicrobiaceae bacterium]
HRPRSEPLADLLQGGWIFTRTEPIIEGLITNSSFFKLPFSPLHPNGRRRHPRILPRGERPVLPPGTPQHGDTPTQFTSAV